MQRAQSDDELRHASLRSNPLMLERVGSTPPVGYSCWGGRPHGIACQNWAVNNQDRSRP